jgi:Na+/proline symporter
LNLCFFHAVSGFPTWASILTGGVVATIYTALGGIKAVIWTDVFQSIVMLGGLMAMIIMGTIHMGGPSAVFHTACNGSRLSILSFDPSPTVRLSFWSLVIGGTFADLPRWGVSQTSVQRMLTSRSLASAKRQAYVIRY